MSSYFVFLIVSVSSISLILPSELFAHGKEKHVHPTALLKEDVASVQVIDASFQKLVKPIFEKKCLDCHGGQTNYPWYYKIPGARQLINYDIAESKEHMDFTSAFPFKGHHSAKEDLESIAEVIEKEEMPPWRYRVFHSETKVTAEEKVIIINWTQDSLRMLK